MSFLHLEYLAFLLAGLAFFWFFTVKVEKRFFEWIKDHWFYKPSIYQKVSRLFYLAGFSLIALALLDLRGPETRVTGKVSDQKTVLLIDASASMLAEDVRPNRFEKAVLLAKHFIKKSVGHQISVVVFSDGQKRIVPFTKDMDLIEARLNTLENLDLERGGTGLTLAIQESIQYFITSENRPFGNILILTDAEETDGGLELDVPEGISVAVVGIGTAKGAPIPMRSPRGAFQGNKKHQGETVITKLDEEFLKKLGEEVEHYKYWVASSYSLPTEEILIFFNRALKTKSSRDDFRIRPVLANYLLAPGVVALALAFLLKNFKTFTLALLIVASLDAPSGENSQEERVKSEKIISLEKKFAENELGDEGKKKLATELLKEGFSEDSKNLFNEILTEEVSEANKREQFNLGAAQFKANEIDEGMRAYTKLLEHLEKHPGEENKELAEKAKQNMLKAIQVQASQQSKKDQEKNEQKNQEKNGEEGSSKGEGDPREGQEGKPEQDKENGDNQEKKKDGENEENDKKEPQDSQGKVEKEKMPSILKQLLSDDNQLQKKVIDADTVERKTRDKKDW